MGNDIETGSRQGILLSYSANLPSFNNLEEHRKQKQTILLTVLNGSYAGFYIYMYKIMKK